MLAHADRAGDAAIDPERRRRTESVQRVAPVGLGLPRIAGHQPFDVVTVGTRTGQGDGALGMIGLVQREQLLHEHRPRPRIEQHVMMAPDELVHVRPEPDQREPQQRRPREIDALGANLAPQRVEPALLCRRVEMPPVFLPPRRGDLSVDHLHRRRQAVGHEGGAQNGVSIDQRSPRAPEGRHVERALNPAARLSKYIAVSGASDEWNRSPCCIGDSG